jgi:MATE family multidrug resistance protein
MEHNNSERSHDELTGIHYLIPNAICKLLASGSILINFYWSKSHEVQLIGMGVAMLFSFAFGYLIIICLNLSLAYSIGRKRSSFTEIGIYYQRALVINFLICAFLITPLLYISNKVVLLFVHIDSSLSEVIGDYLFQLVPSIYCFAFYDTTQTYLLSQGHFLTPLVINIFAFFCHLYFIEHLGAAWSKNLADFGRSTAVYLHLVLRQKKLQSWIEWTLQCFKGWENHLRHFRDIGLTTYIHAFFNFFFAIIGYRLPTYELICHICFINIVQMIFIVNIGLKEGLIVKLAYYLKKRKARSTREIGLRTPKIFFAVSLLFVFFMMMYIDEICEFFFVVPAPKEIFKARCWMMFLSVIVYSLNTSLATLTKIFNKTYSLISTCSPISELQIGFMLLGSLTSYILCYQLQMGLSGLWYGLIFGCTLNFIFNWIVFARFLNGRKEKKEALILRKEYDEDDF